jgi:hypothetical protein
VPIFSVDHVGIAAIVASCGGISGFGSVEYSPATNAPS